MQIILGWWLLYSMFRGGESSRPDQAEFSLWRILALILGFVGLMLVVHFATRA